MDVIEKYICAVGEVSLNSTGSARAAYGAVSGWIYLYIDPDLWPLLDKIDMEINDHDYSSSLYTLHDLCRQLAKNQLGTPDQIHPDQTD